ncbi:MAG: hypothetical protein HQL73_02445 [Magnetococcales bacterium]|nr:hypothetical protein [Magnetococcales bacterium]
MGLRLGVSSLSGQVKLTTSRNLGLFQLATVTDSDAQISTYSAEYTKDKLTLLAEYSIYDQDNKISTRTPLSTVTMTNRSILGGWYSSVSYRMTSEFETSAYYSAFYWDLRDKKGTNALGAGIFSKDYMAWQKDLAMTGRYDIDQNWMVKLEGHWMDGTALAVGTPSGRYWTLWAFKAIYSF